MSKCILFCLYNGEARGSEPCAGVNGRPADGHSRALTDPQREEIPLASTKAESDELLLLEHRVRSKGKDLRTQKFCRLPTGAAISFWELIADQSFSELIHLNTARA